MVKVTGPAMSLTASGSIAGALVFSTWKGRPYVRSLVKPSNPQTQSQQYNRAWMRFLARKWAMLTDPQKASWDDPADNDKISGFNAFVKYNLSNMIYGENPIAEYGGADVALGSAEITLSATGGQRRAALQIDIAAPRTNQMGVKIFRTTGVSMDYTPAQLIDVIPCAADAAVLNYLDAPLAPDDYIYGASLWSISNHATILSDEETAVTVTT